MLMLITLSRSVKGSQSFPRLISTTKMVSMVNFIPANYQHVSIVITALQCIKKD